MSFQDIEGGDRGEHLNLITGYPIAALVTVLDDYKENDTYKFEEVFVRFTTGAANEISIADSGEIPHGRIYSWKPDTTYSYILTILTWAYEDVESTLIRCGGGNIYQMYYGDQSVSLGQQVKMAAVATGVKVVGCNTGGVGFVRKLDTTNQKAYVMV